MMINHYIVGNGLTKPTQIACGISEFSRATSHKPDVNCAACLIYIANQERDEARQWAKYYKALADDYHGAQIMIANERNRTVKENAELRRQLEESQEWDKFWHKQYDMMLNNYNLLANKSADELGIDSLAPVSIPEKIKELRRQLQLAADALSDIRHGAIALSAEESEKLYRKIAAETLARMDDEK